MAQAGIGMQVAVLLLLVVLFREVVWLFREVVWLFREMAWLFREVLWLIKGTVGRVMKVCKYVWIYNGFVHAYTAVSKEHTCANPRIRKQWCFAALF